MTEKHRETAGFQLVGGEMGCGIYRKGCPLLSVTELGGEVLLVVEGRWGAAGLGGDETGSAAFSSLQTAHLS